MTSFDYRSNPLYSIKECSSCGALYTTNYCCSEGILRDKIIRDLNQTPDLTQRSPQNCPKCGNPVDGHYCQEPFNNQTIKELSPTVPSFDPTCYSKDENSFTYDSTSNLVYDSPNVFDTPPQLPLYSSEFCRNDARYGHYCTPQKEKEKQIEEEQTANARYWKILACYNDYDDDYIIAIIYKEPDNSLNSLKKIYSNPLFDKEITSMKIDPHHFNAKSDLIEYLLNYDSSIITSSSKIDSLFDEFAGELTLLKSIPPGINETDCDLEEETHFIKRLLYDNSSPRPPEEFVSKNSDPAFESFSPSPIPVKDSDSLMEEIDLSFTLDDPMPPGIEEESYDSERDILILDELLSNDSLSFPKNESFYFDIPSSSPPPTKPPDGNTEILNVKVMGDISEHRVRMPRLMFTQPTLVANQEKSLDLLSHLGHEAFQPSTECPMMIYRKNTPILDVLFFYFYPPRSIQVLGELGQAERP
nr:hypothetical protein [Tanacetum cinerariifolium]